MNRTVAVTPVKVKLLQWWDCLLILATILPKLWGSQSWLQPAFSRRLPLPGLAPHAKEPP
jgi:hypothetical protein